MQILAHRGNTKGPSRFENHPDQIRECLAAGFGVEIDLWQEGSNCYLGHDAPQYPIELDEFDRLDVFFHLKSAHLPNLLRADAFAIVCDPFVVTLRGRLWANYGQNPSPNSVMCSPDLVGANEALSDFRQRIIGAHGVCTDFPLEFRS